MAADEEVQTNIGLVRLTEQSQRVATAMLREHLDALARAFPPPEPPSLRRRIKWWIYDRRYDFAEWLRRLADKIA